LTRQALLVEQEILSDKQAGVDKAPAQADFREADREAQAVLEWQLFRGKAGAGEELEEAEAARVAVDEEAVKEEAEGKSRLATEWARCGERSESCGRQ
jgi:hypothetical protein